MTTFTRSDFCQGHGGGRDCTYSPEVGECVSHGDMDHGVISYCDGTCASALEAWQDYLQRAGHVQVPLPQAGIITLDVYGHGRTPESYRVVFEGPDAEAWATAYIKARPGFSFSEAVDAPNYWSTLSGAFLELLHPTCHHGLAAENCMDPIGEHHFGTRDWEMSHYGVR